MVKPLWLAAGCLLVASSAPGNTYRVRNSNDSGVGSLRWALEQANSHIGRDVIVFAPRMSGKVIRPGTELPTILDHRTIIDGDTDDDGKPDVALNGGDLAAYKLYYSGLQIQGARYCKIIGLAVTNFQDYGIAIRDGKYNTVQSCHLGVNLAGTKAVPNGDSDLFLDNAHHNTIGGASASEGNVFGCGGYHGVHVYGSDDNTLTGNCFGLARGGMSVLGTGVEGIQLYQSDGNQIGGPGGRRNLFGGLNTGTDLDLSSNNTIGGNYFGLGRDGSTPLAIQSSGVLVRQASTHNTIGGTTTGARNVFAGGATTGVQLTGSGVANNKVQGNYFGMNAAGTKRRRLVYGVSIDASAGAQLIGGGTAKAGNYFVSTHPTYTVYGCVVGSGADTVVQRNRFGVLPAGGDAPADGIGLIVRDVRVYARHNLFARWSIGVLAHQSGSNARMYGNTFRHCGKAVVLENDGRAHLGDLGNTKTSDDGGNTFRTSNGLYIYNVTPHRISAEGNDFGTTSRVAINKKIYDRKDDPTKGRVDFSPLAGGVIPTGRTIAVTSATAHATPHGVEVLVGLSAPASVSVRVLNIAGRPVEIICRARQCGAGTHTLLWNARSDNGLPVPNGTYLVQVTARSVDGSQASGLAQVRIAR
jgi:hypothetical protein